MAELNEAEKAINGRLIDLYKFLKANGVIKNKSDFARRVDMPKEYMTLFEQNKRFVPGHFLVKILNSFDVSTEWINTGKGNMFNEGATPRPGHNVTGNKIKGSGNAVGINSQAGAGDLQAEVDRLQREVEHLTQRLKDKEEMIELLKKK